MSDPCTNPRAALDAAYAAQRKREPEDRASKANGADSLDEFETRAPPQRNEPPAHILVHDAGDIDITKIPPRGWQLGVTFCRKFISGLIGEGGTGKTAIRYIQYLAVASGRTLTGEHVHHRCRVLIVCLEDNLDEVRRRIGAAMLHHQVSPDDVKGWLFYCTPKGLKLLQTGPDGIRTIGHLYSELIAAIATLQIDLVGIDPFVKSHGVEENDNNAIDQVCTMLADIGDRFDCAIDILSHARKGQASPGDAERERGASAKKDAGRLIRTVTGMTIDEAEVFSVNASDRGAMIRVDDAKVNLTPRSTDAMWFKLISVSIGNGTEAYPHGDSVQTVERWYPPDSFAKLNTISIDQILNKIEAGPYEDGRYSSAANATDRAAWKVVQQICPDFTDKQAKHVIKTWLKNGVLVKQDHEDPKDRHNHPSLFVGQRPSNTWES
jgi:AAA domain